MVFIKKTEAIMKFLSKVENLDEEKKKNKKELNKRKELQKFEESYIEYRKLDFLITKFNSKNPDNKEYLYKLFTPNDILYTTSHENIKRELEKVLFFIYLFNKLDRL